MFFPADELEIRASAGGRYRLRGRFPYNKTAVLSDGGKTGKPQKEVFKPGAFKYSVDQFNKMLSDLANNAPAAVKTAQALIKSRPADVQAMMDEAHGILKSQGLDEAAYLLSKESDIYILHGHDFSQPLANGATQTLALSDTPTSLNFEAEISDLIAQTSWASDLIKQIMSGLSIGLSPGFRVPPKRASADAETFQQEPNNPDQDQHGAIIRLLWDVILYELSVVTRPAYKAAAVSIEQRSVSGPYVKSEYSILRYR